MRGGPAARAADVARSDSISNRFRSKRFERFADVASTAAEGAGPLRVLDIGGTTEFWRQRGWLERADVEVTLANLAGAPLNDETLPVRQVKADATDLPFEDGSFDVVFSNSTIEHLFSWQAQRRMADEVRRLAPVYWVQTPNFWFPVEPHFLTPAWQYLPVRLRARLIERRKFGHRGPCSDPIVARDAVEEIRLLTRRDLNLLFPDAQIEAERVGPFAKSLIAIRFA